MSQPLVSLRGLRKRYGKRRALDGVDLTIDGQQIFGIVGPDGAGKTRGSSRSRRPRHACWDTTCART